MTLVSLTNCCHLLAIDPKTLRRWMSLAQLTAQPSPHDARLKCLQSEQVQKLATVHHRTLPEKFEPHFPSEISASAAPAYVVSAPVLSDILPDFPALLTDFTRQLGSLRAYVASLQDQLALLTEQLQMEQQRRASDASTLKDKSLESSQDKSLEPSRDKSLESSQDKSPESSQDKSLESSQDKSPESSQDKSLEPSQDKSLEMQVALPPDHTPSIDRRKHPHVLPLVEYGAEGAYVVVCPERGRLEFLPDSPEWFAWLSALSSFRFMGMLGRFTAHRGGSTSPNSSWRASRQIRNRSYNHHLGKTEGLTVTHLEQVAAILQSHLN